MLLSRLEKMHPGNPDTGGVIPFTRRIRRLGKLDTNLWDQSVMHDVATQVLDVKNELDAPAIYQFMTMMVKSKRSDLFTAAELCAVAEAKHTHWSLRQLAGVCSAATKLGLTGPAERLLMQIDRHLAENSRKAKRVDPSSLGFLCDASFRLGLNCDAFLDGVATAVLDWELIFSPLSLTQVEEKFPKEIFRVNREMRDEILVYESILEQILTKLASKCKENAAKIWILGFRA